MPTKRERCLTRLQPLRGDGDKLAAFLMKYSGLPGRRADIELAAALADMFDSEPATEAERQMLRAWLALSPDEAPVNSKSEFLPFCAAQALGVLYSQADVAERDELFSLLRAASRDPRWRTREGACFAFQRMAEHDFDDIERRFSSWLERGNMMDRRSMIVSLAHPPVLGDAARVDFCLGIADSVMGELEKLPSSGRKTEEYRVLRKGMEFAVSVYAAAAPEQGFAFLGKWASSENVETKKIVAANLRKSRLARKYPERCQEVGEILSSGF